MVAVPRTCRTACVAILLSLAVDSTCIAQSKHQNNEPPTAKQLYAKTLPAVVQVIATLQDGSTSVGTGFFVKEAAGDKQRNPQGDFLKAVDARASGPRVATCFHVIKNATKILIKGAGGAQWSISSLVGDEQLDVALLSVTPVDDWWTAGKKTIYDDLLPKRKENAEGPKPRQEEGLSTSHFSLVGVGDDVVVIGNPLGFLTNTLSTGVVSGKRKSKGIPLIQITAPVSEGSSGSPVLNKRGEVIGIVSFTFRSGQSLNMAVASNALADVARNGTLYVPGTSSAATEGSGSLTNEADVPKGQPVPPVASDQTVATLRDVVRTFISLVELNNSSADKTSSADGFERRWDSVRSDFVAKNVNGEALAELVDDFSVAMTRLANANADIHVQEMSDQTSAESLVRTKAASDALTARTRDAIAIYQKIQIRLFILAFPSVSERFDPATAFYADGRLVSLSNDRHDIVCILIPDPQWSDSCIVATDLLGPGSSAAINAYLAREADRFISRQRLTPASFEEATRELSVLKAGERILAVRKASEDWTDTRTWRDLSAFLKLQDEAKDVPLILLVGSDKTHCRAVTSWALSPKGQPATLKPAYVLDGIEPGPAESVATVRTVRSNIGSFSGGIIHAMRKVGGGLVSVASWNEIYQLLRDWSSPSEVVLQGNDALGRAFEVLVTVKPAPI